MTLPITPAGPAAPRPATPGAGPDEANLRRVAQEFESMLVRQLLAASRMEAGGEAYGEMATDALASGLARGGGLGLARHIQDALTRAHLRGSGR